MMRKSVVSCAVSKLGVSLALSLLVAVVGFVLLGIARTEAQGTQPVPVDSQVRVSFSGLVLNRATNTYDTVATLTNISTTPVSAPLSLVITSITPSSVQLADGTGTTPSGLPYLNVPLPTGRLEPGATLTGIVVKFNNPSRATFTFTQTLLGILGPANHAPKANAGADQTVTVGETVRLDGSDSTDVDGNALTYRWSLVAVPTGSPAALAGPTTVNPTFVADRAGTYIAQLIVNDGQVNSAPAAVVISTVNSAPVANAGPNRIVASGTIVQLDGTQSTDVDGDALTYRWTLVSIPSGSQAVLLNPNTITPSFSADRPGIYTAQLIVNDGQLDSAPATVVVSTQAVLPVADAGADQKVVVGTNVQLDGSRSFALTGASLTYRWALLTRPAGSVASVINATTVNPGFVVDKTGIYVVQLIVNDGQLDSVPATVVVTTANTRPVADAGPNQTAQMGQTVTLDGRGSRDADNDPLIFLWSLLAKPANSGATLTGGNQSIATFVADQPGTFVAQLVVSDGQLDSVPETTTVTVTVPPPNRNPQITSSPPLTGQVGVYSYQVLASDPDGDSVSYLLTVSPSGMSISGSGLISWTPSAAGSFAVSVSVSDGRGGSASQTYNVGVSSGTSLPPDPATVAPPLDPTVANNLFDATGFLYKGTNPIQTGVAAGTIDPNRVAVLRGKVADRSGAALSGVRISIVGHPEFGQTLSRADGGFDLVANGGGALTVRYEKTGYLAAQRQAPVAWQDFTLMPDVVLVARDAQVTTVNFGTATTGMQVARGSVQSDGDGTRRATVFIPAGTTAGLVQPDGSIVPANTLNIRLTEYTVGPNGPQAMPAGLPPTSAYTYAVELGADETVAKVNGRDVVFNQPVILYVENFLNMPVGKDIPIGYYDPTQSAWVGSPNGRVIKIVGNTAGVAALDVDGDGVADGAAALAALGITAAERQQLASQYAVGASLWRTPIDHFSTVDCNWPYVCKLPGCVPPKEPPPLPPPPCQNSLPGSVIGCERQTLGEHIALTGSTFSLHYQSDRVPGRTAEQNLLLSLGTGGIPSGVQSIQVEILVAGKKLFQQLPANTTSTAIAWDFKDVYGRPVQGSEPVTVRVGYAWDVVYSDPAGARIAWARLSGVPMSQIGIPGRQRQVVLWQERTGKFSRWDERAHGLGGWSLSVLHAYDPIGKVLHLGDGTRREEEARALTTIRTVAGGGTSTAEGIPATQASMYSGGVAVGPDGSIYPAEQTGHKVRRVAPDGRITTIAGTGSAGFGGDNGPATQAQLNQPIDVALGPDGSVYIVDSFNYRIRRVLPNGTITTVAGNGTQPFNGDGLPATQTAMQPGRIAVDADGTVYFTDIFYQTNRVRAVDQNGIVSTIAGSGSAAGFSGDGGPATAAKLALNNWAGIALGPDGSVYVADRLNNRIRQVNPQGVISTIAGTGAAGYSGDGGPGTSAALLNPSGLAWGRDGALYIADLGNKRLRRLGSDGIINTVAGTGLSGFSGDGGAATQARLDPLGVVEGPDGALYVSGFNGQNGRIRRIVSALPGFSFANNILLPSADGREVYVFSGNGRHLQTVDGLTGGLRYQFTYDAAGYPISVTDGSNNVTTIERTGAIATAIIAPGGHRTALVVNGDGWLTSATNPAGETRALVSTAAGLLQEFTDPRGNTYRFTYDTLGRLIKDEDPAGGSTRLARTEQSKGYTVTTTSALGRTRSYQVEQLSTGALQRTVVEPSGAKTVTIIGTNSDAKITDPTGSIVTLQYGADPRWGMLAPLATNIVVTTPGGRKRTVTIARTATLPDPANPFSMTKLTETITDNAKVTTSVYDAALRSLTITSPAGRINRLNLDALGRVTQAQTASLAPIGLTYNSQGLLSTILAGSSTPRTTSFTYNASREVSDVKDPIGRTTNFAYDLAQRPLTQTLPDGRKVELAYDRNGNVVSVTPPGRPTHAFSYNAVDVGMQYNPPDIAGVSPDETTTSFNADRQPTLVARPDGRTIVPLYDSAGRLSSVAFSRGSLGITYAPTSGLPTALNAPDSIGHAFTYDGGLMLSHTLSGPVPGVLAWTYDNDFRIASQSVNGAATVNLTYDRDGLLTRIGGLVLTRDSANGLLTGTSLNTVTDGLIYNTHAELVDYRAKVGSTDVYRTQLTRDALGRITQKIETIQGVTDTYVYTYDLSGRLIGLVKNGSINASYTYDANSNRTSYTGPLGAIAPAQISADAQDRLTKYGANTYTYNAHGELTSKTNGTGTTSYVYDEFGNLKQVVLPGGAVIDYVIDAMNRRIGKKVNGTLIRRWLWDDRLRIVAELDGAGNLLSRFVYATRPNVPDYVVQGGNTLRLVTDYLGSPRLLINSATGAVAGAMNHDEYGRVTQDTMSALVPFGFAGGLYDPATGLVRFGTRDYDPEVGRWTSKDSIRFLGGSSNLYAYVRNNPLHYVDPDGLRIQIESNDSDIKSALERIEKFAPPKYAELLRLLKDYDDDVNIHIQKTKAKLDCMSGSAGACRQAHSRQTPCASPSKHSDKRKRDFDVFVNPDELKANNMPLDVALFHELIGHFDASLTEKRAQERTGEYWDALPASEKGPIAPDPFYFNRRR